MGRAIPPHFSAMQDREEFISSRDYSRLRELVYDEAGINLGSERRTMLEGRIRRRLKDLAIHSYGEYCDYLFSGEGLRDELVHLIDVVTTNKTDFFREPRHFEFLTATALPEFVAANAARRPLLVWSAACSTGEEPYTLAMVLSEYGLTHPGFAFRIVATDISTTVLKKAELGIYSADAVRPVPQSLKVKYFMRGRERSFERVRVVPELRRLDRVSPPQLHGLRLRNSGEIRHHLLPQRDHLFRPAHAAEHSRKDYATSAAARLFVHGTRRDAA